MSSRIDEAGELNGNERSVLNVLAGTYHRERHQGDMMICQHWPCYILVRAIQERDVSTIPTETSARCLKCGCTNGVDANGWCLSGRPYIANQPDSNQRSICPCKCVFPASTEQAGEQCGECKAENNWHLATCSHWPFRVAPVTPTQQLAVKQPRIICLCGSTRFIELFAIKTWELEREGNIVLGCTLLPMWYCQVPDHFGEATGTKEQCDELHLRKIDLADEVLVLNVDGYIGSSTKREIEYATATGKPVRYLSDAAPAPPVAQPEADPLGICLACEAPTSDPYCVECTERYRAMIEPSTATPTTAAVEARRCSDEFGDAVRRTALSLRATYGIPTPDYQYVEQLIRERVAPLVFIGEHYHSDLTWKARCLEASNDLNENRAEISRLKGEVERLSGELNYANNTCKILNENVIRATAERDKARADAIGEAIAVVEKIPLPFPCGCQERHEAGGVIAPEVTCRTHRTIAAALEQLKGEGSDVT